MPSVHFFPDYGAAFASNGTKKSRGVVSGTKCVPLLDEETSHAFLNYMVSVSTVTFYQVNATTFYRKVNKVAFVLP